MMMKENIYWLYLEPYTFLFKEKEEFLIYNTLNSAYINCSTFYGMEDILNELNNSNGYSIGILKERISDKNFVAFVREIRKTYSGDIVKNTTGIKPFIFKPILRLYSHPDNLKIKEENLLGMNILHYLHEINFYIDDKCDIRCAECKSYFHQFDHCTVGENLKLGKEDYRSILNQLYISQLNKINIITSYPDKELVHDILEMSRTSSLKKEIITHYRKGISDMIINMNNDAKVSFRIMISFPFDIVDIEKEVKQCSDKNITWVFIVTKEEDISILNNIVLSLNTEYIPYYNKCNLTFFEKYVYNDISDIIEIPIEKQIIFRRQVLNENFFGKLSIFPNGDVYSNNNYPSIGNIIKSKLTEIIYYEVTQTKAWMKMRDEGACKECVNKYLCPSISNYELVLNKPNLCHIVRT